MGRRCVYAESGLGQPLLLVHGFPLDHSMWTAIDRIGYLDAAGLAAMPGEVPLNPDLPRRFVAA